MHLGKKLCPIYLHIQIWRPSMRFHKLYLKIVLTALLFVILQVGVEGVESESAFRFVAEEKVSGINRFGSSVSLSDNGWAIIGTDQDDYANIYMFNETIDEWIFCQKLVGAGYFGTSHSISNTGWIIVGTQNTDNAYFYRLNESSLWELSDTKTGFRGLGSNSALSNTGWALVAARTGGYVNIYRYENATDEWTWSRNVTYPDSTRLGLSLDISDNGWAAMGDSNDGLVLVYRLNSTTNEWLFHQIFTGDTTSFGVSVAISDDGWLIIGKSSIYTNNFINIYRANESNYFVLYQKIAGPDFNFFGGKVSISNTGWALVSSFYGDNGNYVELYGYNSTSKLWHANDKMTGSNGYGISVSLSKNTGWMMVGTENGNKAFWYMYGCEAGSKGSMEQGKCTLCSAGTYSTLFSGLNTSRICETCPVNMYSEVNSTVCSDCASGFSCISATPWSGPITGGTDVVLSGSFFATEPMDNVQLRFRNSTHNWSVSNQVIEGKEAINCTTLPVVGVVGWVDIDINTKGTWVELAKFQYYIPPIPFQPTPKSGPIEGNTIITINGTFLTSTNQAWCRFAADGYSSKEVTANLLGDGKIQCSTPAWNSAANCTVSISINQQQYSVAGWFQFYDASVSSALPGWGPSTGQTYVLLSGSGLIDSGDDIKVKISNTHAGGSITEIVAGALVDGKIAFVTLDLSGYSMSLPYIDTLRLYVTMNGQSDQYTSTFVPFSLYENSYTISPSGFVPNCGPADGSASVTISGSGYVNTGEIRVNVKTAGGANITTPAIFQSSTTLQAVLPASQIEGEAQVSVALNGQQFTISRPFTYFQVSSIFPILGPEEGGFLVTVSGSGFVGAADKIRCKFGSMTPFAPYSFSETQILCKAVATTARSISIEVSANGNDYTNSSIAHFTYYAIPTISTVSPSTTYEFGGVRMTISGGTFLNSSTLTVAFIESTLLFTEFGVNPSYVSSSEILCNVPSIEHRSGLSFPVSVFVEVRLNGEILGQTNSQKTMTYIESGDRKPTSISPLYGAMGGGTMVTITGTLMGIPADTVVCRFRDSKETFDEKVNGTVADDEKITCLAPNLTVSEVVISVTVSVSKKNDSSVFVGSLKYLYYTAPESVQPKSGPVTGSSYYLKWKETISDFSMPVRVKVSNVVIATVQGPMNFTMMHVNLTDLTSGLQGVSTLPAICSFELEIDTASEIYAPADQTVKIYSTQSINSIWPTSGPDSGQTRVTVTGTGFTTTDDPLRIRLQIPNKQPIIITGEFKTVTQIEFVTTSIQNLNLSLPINASIEVALNGILFEKLKSGSFLYYEQPNTTAVFPAAGPKTGNTNLMIYGTNFVNTGTIKAEFRSDSGLVSYLEVMSAQFINSTLLSCKSPEFPLLGVTLPYSVKVEVDLNGYSSQKTSDGNTFTFYSADSTIAFSLSPRSIPLDRSSQLLLKRTGEAFVNTGLVEAQLMVLNVSHYIRATSVTSDTIIIAVPVLGNMLDSPITITVTVSLNAQQYSPNDKGLIAYGSPSLIGVSPPSGPVAGGTQIIISAQNLTDPGTDEVTLRLKSVSDPTKSITTTSCTIVISTSTVNCSVPSMSGTEFSSNLPHNATLALALNGQDYTVDPVHFLVYSNPVVSSISPLYIPITGQTELVTEGSGFIESELIKLRLKCGSSIAFFSATRVSGNRLSVQAPDLTSILAGESLPVTCNVDISLNDQQYFATGLKVYVYAIPTFTSISPHGGPVTGSTVLTVKGTGFIDTGGTMTALFVISSDQNRTMAVQFESATRLKITTPSLDGYGVSLPVNITVLIAGNGQQYLDKNPLYFQYYLQPTLNTVTPHSGPKTGATEVTIYGVGFLNTGETTVVFYSQTGGVSFEATKPAVYKSAIELQCESPIFSLAGVVLPYEVYVEVTMNGQLDQRTTLQNVTFQFYGAADDYKFTSSPNSGPVSGGTSVILARTGLMLVETLESVVRFNAANFNITTNATSGESGSIMQVTTPDFRSYFGGNLPATLTLRLSLNGQQFGSMQQSFVLYEEPHISDIEPKSAPITGATNLEISGTNFNQAGTDELNIRLSHKGVKITTSKCHVQSSILMNCTIPSMSTTFNAFTKPLNVSLSLTLNNQQYVDSASTPLTVYNEPTLTKTVPIRAPTTGGTSVEIEGTEFLNTNEITVRLQCGAVLAAVMTGVFVNSARIATTMPNMETQLSGVTMPSTCSVNVALNGKQYEQSNTQFYVYSNPSPSTITPHSGPKTAITNIFVDGTGFENTGNELKLRYRYENQSLDGSAVFFNSSRLQATIPILPWSVACPFTVYVSVGLNGQQFVGSAVFTVFEIPTVTSVAPVWDLPRGGEWVFINGTGFMDTNEITVVFTDANLAGGTELVSYSAQFISSTQIRCRSPNHTEIAGNVNYPRPVSVSVRLNGRQNSQSAGGPTFRYEEDCSMNTYSINSGPLNGGTNITVIGKNFFGGITCIFAFGANSIQIPALVQSDTSLICQAPNFTTYRNQSLLTRTSFSILKRRATLPVRYDYYVIPTIDRVNPDWSHPNGGNTLTVFGTSFSNTGFLQCKIGTAVVSAIYANSTAVQCVIPAQAVSQSTAVQMHISISQNGQQWHQSDTIQLLYKPCPEGTSAKLYTDPCTYCIAGNYNPWEGQVTCLECPANSYCIAGSSQPKQCPSNSVSLKGATDLEKCLCLPGYYSESGLAGKPCTQCPIGAECLGGTARPYSLPGYWNSWSENDFQFYRCPASDASCAGGSNRTLECRVGYSGRMCSQCVELYYKLEEICVKCPDNPLYTIFLSIIVFLLLIYLLKRFGGIQGSGASLSVSVGYLQVTGLFADFRLEWAQPILDFLSRLTFINLNIDVASPECSLENWGYTERFAATMLMPAVALVVVALWHCVSLISWKFGKYFKKQPAIEPNSSASQTEVVDIYDPNPVPNGRSTIPVESLRSSINAFLMMLSLLYIILGSKALEPFDCTQLAGGKYSLDAFPEMECWTGEHLRLIPWAIICTVVYVAGIPILFISILVKNRSRVRNPQDEAFQRTAGVLFKKYQSHWYWWEAVIMCRKLLLIAIKLNLTNFPLVQGVLGILVLLISLVLQSYARPFARRSLDRLESALLTCNFLVLISGLMFLSDKFEPAETKEVVVAGTLAILGVSIAFVLLFFLYELRIAFKSFRAKSMDKRNSVIFEFWKDKIPSQKLHLLRAWLSTHADEVKSEPMKKAISQYKNNNTPPDIFQTTKAVLELTYDSRKEHEILMNLICRSFDETELQPFVEMLRWMKEEQEASKTTWYAFWGHMRRNKGVKTLVETKSRAATEYGEGIELNSMQRVKSADISTVSIDEMEIREKGKSGENL